MAQRGEVKFYLKYGKLWKYLCIVSYLGLVTVTVDSGLGIRLHEADLTTWLSLHSISHTRCSWPNGLKAIVIVPVISSFLL